SPLSSTSPPTSVSPPLSLHDALPILLLYPFPGWLRARPPPWSWTFADKCASAAAGGAQHQPILRVRVPRPAEWSWRLSFLLCGDCQPNALRVSPFRSPCAPPNARALHYGMQPADHWKLLLVLEPAPDEELCLQANLLLVLGMPALMQDVCFSRCSPKQPSSPVPQRNRPLSVHGTGPLLRRKQSMRGGAGLQACGSGVRFVTALAAEVPRYRELGSYEQSAATGLSSSLKLRHYQE